MSGRSIIAYTDTTPPELDGFCGVIIKNIILIYTPAIDEYCSRLLQCGNPTEFRYDKIYGWFINIL
ncbi:hypothetical protein NZ698_12250 [Chryseobacterium sp. PBS4-4]|uniref:Uncharacterized protein n=1 Tax=Chryseobacterium edaphi TaxID=2976532 RepID=A0ABT2W9N7_9FLAO|nr:hypothetical protein [Chryseobacterium edaphi]MCU7617972.1 hypothetical protein [Chryseobacterium edaphi]